MNLQDIALNDLANHYAKLRETLEAQELSFKEWKKDISAQIDLFAAEILRRIRDDNHKKIETSIGTFSTITRNYISVAKAETFTNWLKADSERLKYAVVEARKVAIKEYVDEHGEPPEGVSFERGLEIVFRRHS